MFIRVPLIQSTLNLLHQASRADFGMDRKVLKKVLSGLSDRNLRFRDLLKLLNAFRFSERVKGNHHIFFRDGVEEIINLQPLRDGKAKAYQVKQVRNIIIKYKLHEDDRDV